MEWIDLIEKRHTTFAWAETIPKKELILEALQEVHTHIPSKNLQFPYQVRLYRNDNFEKRKKIMEICHRNSSFSIDKDPGNPQVLAPWLLIFNSRYCADLEGRFDKKSPRKDLDGLGINKKRTHNKTTGRQQQTENIEIGIFSAYVMLSLANKGIQTGMCQNICCDYDAAEKIFPIAHDERAIDLRFLIGVGYGKDRTLRHEYLDPRTNTIKKIPYITHDTDQVYGRPAFEDIIIDCNE